VPFDCQRAPAQPSLASVASEPSLQRLDAQQLTRVSVLLPLSTGATGVTAKLRAWLDHLDGRQGEIVVVADGSAGDAWKTVAELASVDERVRLIRHARRGFGEALRKAIQQMRGDIALIAPLDAAPVDTNLDAWLRPIRGGLADAVLAAPSSAPPRSVSRPRPLLAQRMTTRCLNAMFGLSLSEGWSAPIAVRADVLRHLRLTSHGDEIVTELICRLAQWDAKIREIACDTQSLPRRAGLLRHLMRAVRCRAWDTQFTTHAGFYILTAVAKADQYNRWIVDQVRPFLGRRVLEAGAGIGNLSQLFDDCERLVLADREEVYLDRLEQRFAHDERVRVMPVDLTAEADVEACAAERIDTIFCSNVLEHLEPDEQVLRSFAAALQPGGHCILVVPAGERLYTGIDAALGHFRRYEPAALERKLSNAGLDVVFTHRFSRLGTLGWAVSGHVLRRRTLSPRQMIWFDRLLPVARLLELVLPVPGMSLIMVGRKPLRPAVPQQRRAA